MSTVQILTPESREAWLELRKNYITATDAVAIKGLVPWASGATVLQDKLGLRPRPELNKAMVLGTLLEPLIRNWYLNSREILNEEVVTFGEKVWVEGYLAATPDLIWERDGIRTLIEIKTSSQVWDEIPEHVACQVDHQINLVEPDAALAIYLYLTDAEKDAILIKAAAGKDFDLPRNPTVFVHNWVQAEVEQQAKDMEAWHLSHVLFGEPLPESIPQPVPTFSGVVEMPDQIQTWKQIKDEEKEIDARLKAVKEARAAVEAQMIELLSGNKTATAPIGKLTRTFVGGGMKVDHEGILNALILNDPALAAKVKAIEDKFISQATGYTRWTFTAAK